MTTNKKGVKMPENQHRYNQPSAYEINAYNARKFDELAQTISNLDKYINDRLSAIHYKSDIRYKELIPIFKDIHECVATINLIKYHQEQAKAHNIDLNPKPADESTKEDTDKKPVFDMSEMLTRKEYAKAHNISVRTLDRYIKAGRIPTIKQFGKILIHKDALPAEKC